ncbi:SusC/RagA family TonB-linked outer membrane protein [Echinicola jeungdonensis]|uniref:SusC/RagA family TonB-linked outer membrane protein n=1 Tax=Echinicola jeungdonensis TaxID=709343 RepID=UPI00338F135C
MSSKQINHRTVLSAENNSALPGVNIRIKGTTKGTFTDIDGKYRIQASEDMVLIFSFVGFHPVEVPVANQSIIDVVMETDARILSEILVVGYGNINRRDLTGSVAQISEQTIQDIPAIGIDQAMQGRMAGVQINQNSGIPGAAISVRVRGSSSISASNRPLFVIDGIPMLTGSPSQFDYGGQSIDAITDLSPSDIASIEVLKDASASSIYGSRAANGVILITTKRGADQKTQFNLNVYGGFQELWRKPEFLNRDQYLLLFKDAFAEDFFGEPAEEISDNEILNFYYGGLPYPENTDTDWVDEVTRKGPIQNYELSARGGNDKTQFYISGNYFDQKGVLINSRFQRISSRFNLDHYINDKFSISLNSGITRSTQNRVSSDNTLYSPFSNALAASPLWPVYESDGSYTRPQFFYTNPVAEGTENDDENQSIRVFANVLGSYEILDGLSINVRGGGDMLYFHERSYIPDSYPGSLSTPQGGSGTFATSNVNKWMVEGFLDYKKVLNNLHILNVVIGHNREENLSSSSSVTGIQFPGERFRYIGAAATVNQGSNGAGGSGLESYFGRTNYSYEDKYLFSASFRADASSRFGPNNQWGFFPSVSGGWKINEEEFMDDQEFISDLKIRASVGKAGNQSIGGFAWKNLVGAGNYLETSTIVPVQLGNPDLKWESTTQTDVGIDAGFLDGRIYLIADYYYKKTTDLLFARPIATQNGFGAYQSNIGSIENKGFELTISSININNSAIDLQWRSNFNITFNKNKVLELYNNEDIFYGFNGNSLVLREGEPIGSYYGLIADGVFMTQSDVPESRRIQGIQAGDMNYRDINGDGVITDDDFTIIGNAQPKFYGGLTNEVEFKGFDLQLFLQYSVGNDQWFASGAFQEGMFANFFDDNNRTTVLDRWRSEDDPGNGEIPRAAYDVSVNRNNQPNTTRFVEDGSYLRIKNLVIGYKLPKDLLDRLKMRKIRIFAQAQNLFTFTEYTVLTLK